MVLRWFVQYCPEDRDNLNIFLFYSDTQCQSLKGENREYSDFRVVIDHAEIVLGGSLTPLKVV
jgi:hypothetical protein